jgi:hypothetical protein
VAAINVILFCALYVSQWLCHPFYRGSVNRLMSAIYLLLLYGSVCRLAVVVLYPDDRSVPTHTVVDEVYWAAFIPVRGGRGR